MEEGISFRKGFNQAPLQCIADEEITTVLPEVHSRECDEHQGGLRLAKQVMHLGYHWPTIESDSLSFTRRCKACQMHGNRIHAPTVELHSLATPWPFHNLSVRRHWTHQSLFSRIHLGLRRDGVLYQMH